MREETPPAWFGPGRPSGQREAASGRRGRRRTLAAAVLALGAAGALHADPPLRIRWELGPDYPMGIQDSALGVVGETLVSAGGFTRHPLSITGRYPEAFGGRKSGFTALTFALDLRAIGRDWQRIADLPGPPRQGAAAAVVDDALYVIGGFNYTAPYTYRDVYRLRRMQGKWTWEGVAALLPWPLAEPGVAVVGKRIYLMGGADFHRQPGEAGEDFASERGRGGQPVGKALLMLDTARLAAGWQRLADLPGVSRFDTAVAAAGGKIYSLGGVHRTSGPGYRNAVDAWVFDPAGAGWSQLPDAPQGSNRRAVVWRDRYLVLLGGYRYAITQLPGERSQEVHSPEERRRDWTDFFEDAVLVFDTGARRWSRAGRLRERTSWPMAEPRATGSTRWAAKAGRACFTPRRSKSGWSNRNDDFGRS